MNSIKFACSEISEKEYEVIRKDLKRDNLEITSLRFTGFGPLHEVLIITIELMRNMGYSAAYDIIKSSILYMLGYVRKNKEKVKYIKVIYEDKVSMIETNLDLTQKHKGQLIDAAVVSLIGNNSLT